MSQTDTRASDLIPMTSLNHSVVRVDASLRVASLVKKTRLHVVKSKTELRKRPLESGERRK